MSVRLPAEEQAEREAEVKYLTAVGLSASVIAERLGIDRRTVVRYRKRTGCAKPFARRMTDAEIATAKAMLDDGCSYQEVGRTLGFGGHSIANRYPGYGWTREQISAHGILHRKFSTQQALKLKEAM